VGHERWKFHEPGAVVVGYGASRGEPRGIYEVSTSSRSRLVSEGDRDLHVNISRDGRWIVVDTSGPHDQPGKGWEDVNGVSDILLIDAASGARRWLARTRLGARHPYHPHPCFSPDGRHIYFNEASGEGCGGRVMRIANPEISESE
jgi:Tol biopolymer transport system component